MNIIKILRYVVGFTNYFIINILFNFYGIYALNFFIFFYGYLFNF
jgi:hypothetical protein